MSTSCFVSFGKFVFQGIGPFLLDYQISEHRVFHRIPLLFFENIHGIFMNIHRICSDAPFIISDVNNSYSFFFLIYLN